MPIGYWVIMDMKDFLMYGVQANAEYRAYILYNKKEVK